MNISSFHLISTEEAKVIKQVGTPSCLTMASVFQYAGVSLSSFIKVKALSLEIKRLTFSLESLVSISTVNLFDATSLIAILILFLRFDFLITE